LTSRVTTFWFLIECVSRTCIRHCVCHYHTVNCNGTACCECCQYSVWSETELYYRTLSAYALFHRTIQASWYWFQECIRKVSDFWTRRTMHDMDSFLYSNMFVPNLSRNSTAQIISIKITTYSFGSKNFVRNMLHFTVYKWDKWWYFSLTQLVSFM